MFFSIVLGRPVFATVFVPFPVVFASIFVFSHVLNSNTFAKIVKLFNYH